MIPNGGTPFPTPAETYNAHDNLNGADITAAEILADGTLDGLFGNDGDPWTVEDGKLPGLFGETVDMPEHLLPHTLTGTIRAYAPNTPATIQLLQNGKSIYTATTETHPAYGQQNQSFTFPAVAPGDYTLLITKTAHTSFTVQHITVGTENIDLTASLGVMTLLCGDINGDGMINDSDLAILWSAANYNKSVNDAGVNPLCDLNGDGMINDSDLAILWSAANYNKGAVVIG